MSYVGNKPPFITIPADDSVTSAMIVDGTITSTDMAVDPRNATNLNAGDVPLAQLDNVDTSGIVSNRDDIALLGFRVASNGSLAKYNLVDQTVDAFEDASGVNTGSSSNDNRDSSGKYYSGSVQGVETVTTWTSSPGGGAWTVPAGVTTAEILVVGGAGSGGSNGGGGAGGGGIVHHTTYSLTPAASITVTVGAGQARTTGAAVGVDGGDSVFGTLTAKGGGGGATNAAGLHSGRDGGSGSGDNWQAGSKPNGESNQADFSGATSYGNDAGIGFEQGSPANWYAGGGGGADGTGSTASAGTPSNGGPGRAFSISGSSIYYGAGGGGGTYGSPWTAGSGGTGGGGAGSSTGQGGDGTTYGSGGGGGGTTNGGGGAGYQGIVYAKYTPLSYDNMILISATTAAQAAPTKGDVVFTYTNGAGTTTLGTDVTAEISADGGSTWTAMTLGSEGSTGSHNIATAHDVTISSTITSPWNMAYRIKTFNQSASKTTRIQAISLGWS